MDSLQVQPTADVDDTAVLALIIHAGRPLDWDGRQAASWIMILWPGYDGYPAGGPGGREFHGFRGAAGLAVATRGSGRLQEYTQPLQASAAGGAYAPDREP